jgi:hypothetical protein
MLSLLLVAACAGIIADPNTLLVDFVCNPEGATLYQNQANNPPPSVNNNLVNTKVPPSVNLCPDNFIACRNPAVVTSRTFGQATLTPIGNCPTTLQYKITAQDKANGYMTVRGVTAYWVSGASSSVNAINVNLQNGLHQNIRFERPRDFPAYDTDANYALNLEKNRILRAQAEAQETQAGIATFNNAVAAANAAYANAPPPNLGTHCTTRYLGNTAYTDCY